MPKVSVIIPTYNYGKYIEKAIDSVLAQTYQDFEIIVVDDGSTDNTKEIIETRYKDKVRYFYQENKGAPVARNKGIRKSRGEYLTFLDADDWFAPENLKYKVKVLDNDADAGWVYSDGYYVNKEGEIIDKASNRFSFSNRKLEGDISSELFSMGNYITTDSVLARKTCIIKAGCFDETLPALQDYELWLRISLQYKIKYVDELLCYYTLHSNSISSKRENYHCAFLKIAKKHEFNFIKKAGRIKLRRLKADRYNHLGLHFLMIESFAEANKFFLRSIRCFPFQRIVYVYLLSSIWGQQKRFFTD
jgi:glycosyltransferase involved in cell wall biosynthesis